MDYCSSCRRNLNGALVCPGCGAYAADIAPSVPRYRGDAATSAPAAPTWDAFGTREFTAAAPYPDAAYPHTNPFDTAISGGPAMPGPAWLE